MEPVPYRKRGGNLASTLFRVRDTNLITIWPLMWPSDPYTAAFDRQKPLHNRIPVPKDSINTKCSNVTSQSVPYDSLVERHASSDFTTTSTVLVVEGCCTTWIVSSPHYFVLVIRHQAKLHPSFKPNRNYNIVVVQPPFTTHTV